MTWAQASGFILFWSGFFWRRGKRLSFTLLGSWLSVKIEVTRTVTREASTHIYLIDVLPEIGAWIEGNQDQRKQTCISLRTCTSCRSAPLTGRFYQGFREGGGRGRGAEASFLLLLFSQTPLLGRTCSTCRCRVWGVCPEPLGFFPLHMVPSSLTWSTVSICAAPWTPPGLFSQPPAVRHKLAAGWRPAHAPSLPAQPPPHGATGVWVPRNADLC